MFSPPRRTDGIQIRLHGLHQIERKGNGQQYPASVRISIKKPVVLFGRVVYTGKDQGRYQFKTNRTNGDWSIEDPGLAAGQGGGMSFRFRRPRYFTLPGPEPVTVLIKVVTQKTRESSSQVVGSQGTSSTDLINPFVSPNPASHNLDLINPPPVVSTNPTIPNQGREVNEDQVRQDDTSSTSDDLLPPIYTLGHPRPLPHPRQVSGHGTLIPPTPPTPTPPPTQYWIRPQTHRVNTQPLVIQPPSPHQPPYPQPPVNQPLDNQPPLPQPLVNQPPFPQPLDNQPPFPQPVDNQPPFPQPPVNQPPVNQPPFPQALYNQPPFPQPPFLPPPVIQTVPQEIGRVMNNNNNDESVKR
ncbi:hypothetical protein Pcinc_017445 [Petrolisthes cinctipes]|uniref:Uncharacterized protein n=1 Tax=Petrolisthes cinctipes TaxID=88211 RepID=A0AAE1FP76_PETCI|nr:hypothetical protein Pcinc_017445 [Petrolisthes cinctipes]